MLSVWHGREARPAAEVAGRVPVADSAGLVGVGHGMMAELS